MKYFVILIFVFLAIHLQANDIEQLSLKGRKCSKLGADCGLKPVLKCCKGLMCRQSDNICLKSCKVVLEKCGNGLKCCEGLKCIFGNQKTNSSERYGVCRPKCSDKNGICGTLLGHSCCKGLTCQLPSQCCDFPGVCREPPVCQPEGAQCGHDLKCCEQLVCKLGLMGSYPGQCESDCNGLGEFCGGFAGTKCCNGLTCNAPVQCCDMAGTCELPCLTETKKCFTNGLKCCSGLHCSGGKCQTCGQEGKGCGLNGLTCCSNLVCNRDKMCVRYSPGYG